MTPSIGAAPIVSLTLPAPGKLNLFLHITGRRADGYHLLQTVFQLLDYGDCLEFTLRTDGKLQLHGDMRDVPDEQNLVMRAARLLQASSGTKLGADIVLTKTLPSGGGLGGGSSDAATTLLGLSALWQLNADLDHLATLGLTLGADVPVFVRGHSCWAEGVGEKLCPMEIPEVWYLVLTPPCHVSTADIFNAQELTRNTSAITMAAFLQEGGQNDCQPVVTARFPAVKQALEWLSSRAIARMTGTGASIFAAFTNREEAQFILDQRPDGLSGFVARGVNDSMAHRVLERDYWGIAKR